jgi:hypothetical protein
MIGAVRILKFCDDCIMVLHLLLVHNLVLEGADKLDDLLILKF